MSFGAEFHGIPSTLTGSVLNVKSSLKVPPTACVATSHVWSMAVWPTSVAARAGVTVGTLNTGETGKTIFSPNSTARSAFLGPTASPRSVIVCV